MFGHADAALGAAIRRPLRLNQKALHGLLIVLELGDFELGFDGNVGMSGVGVLLP